MDELLKEIDDLKDDLDEMNYKLQDALYKIENLEIPTINNSIIDIDLFKQKLELNGLANDKLFDFIDLYLKLYNKED